MHRLALALLIVAAIIVVVGPPLESRWRAPELAIRRYLDAIEREDVDAALAALAPDLRSDLRDRVELQLGSRYRVDVLSLGRPSAISILTGHAGARAWATILAEVTPVSGERWKSSSVVDLVELNGVWYLVQPPFA